MSSKSNQHLSIYSKFLYVYKNLLFVRCLLLPWQNIKIILFVIILQVKAHPQKVFSFLYNFHSTNAKKKKKTDENMAGCLPAVVYHLSCCLHNRVTWLLNLPRVKILQRWCNSFFFLNIHKTYISEYDGCINFFVHYINVLWYIKGIQWP